MPLVMKTQMISHIEQVGNILKLLNYKLWELIFQAESLQQTKVIIFVLIGGVGDYLPISGIQFKVKD
jgi:hypothetical protein